jgi:Tol biopolymer transport system component
VSVSTGREQLLVSGGFHGAPSPDGTKLAFVRGSIEDYHVFMAAADGSGETALARGGGRLIWSPDSSALLFSGCARGSVCMVRVDGSGVGQIPVAEPWGGAYSYSPDGTALTFSSGAGYHTSQIEVSEVDGSGRRVITAALGRNADPDWQPLPASTHYRSSS